MASSTETAFVSQARILLGAGFAALEERKQEINDLNVYPVPDGDTGTNLSLTLRGMVEAVTKLPPDVGRKEVCDAISQAALMGARGNSGVILSQMVRGAMDVLGEVEKFDADGLARSLRHATETAYRAVRRPVEGTMLTVLRDMAAVAGTAAAGSHDPLVLFEAAVKEGWRSVERTPSLLKVLADAGVVDAGGYGLVVVLEGMIEKEEQTEIPIVTRMAGLAALEGFLTEEESEEELSAFGYCTSFLLTGEDLDRQWLEDELSLLGDSLLVVGDGSRIKIHVHTDEPGKVIGIGTALGVLSGIEIDNMDEQTQARSARLGGAGSAVSRVDAGSDDPGLTQVVAVVAGEGNKRLFRNLGVDLIVDGGQSMNPSTEDLMRAIDEARAPSIIVLPNNGNIIMTAEQTMRLTEKEVLVLPSRSLQAGLSAVVAYDGRSDGSANARDMRAALETVITGEVTRAVRDSQVDGVEVRAGDFIGLVEEKIVVASADVTPVVESVVARLLENGQEMLTVLVGEGEDAVGALEALESLRGAHDGVEIDVHDGGQPFYPLLLAAE